MENSPRLNLPYILPQQAQKHVTHNEAIRMLDALVQITASSKTLANPPEPPVEGKAYILPEAPAGSWSNHAGELAVFQDGAWAYFTPFSGMMAWIEDDLELIVFNGEEWTAPLSFQNVQALGISATADVQNRLALSSPNSLFDHAGDDHRMKINRNTQSDTASILYQTGYNGNAETGLVESGDYELKVSSDGTHWHTALKANADTGQINFPNSNFLSDHAVNLLQDSGRFCAPTTSILAGPFSKPAYLQEHNGAELSALAKFINNNTNHGGSGGSLHPEVLSLISKIRDVPYRRNGVEFHIAKITKGSGTNYPFTYNGEPYYLTLALTQAMRLAVATAHFYIRPLNGPLLLRMLPGQSVSIDNGPEQNDSVLIEHGAPWQSVSITDVADPYKSWGYTPSLLNILQKNADDEVLIACLSVLGGQTAIDRNTGVMPCFNTWSA